MTSRGWRWAIVTTLIVIGVATEARAGRSGYLDYAENRGVELPAPDPDRALVVFLRPKDSRWNIHASVYDGEEFLSFVQKNTCFLYDAEPGRHRFMVVSESADFLEANLEGGKIYFVRIKPRAGAWRNRFSMFPITKDEEAWTELPGWLEEAFLVTPNESARDWFEANKPSVMSKKSVKLPQWQAKPDAERPTLNPGDGVTGL